MKTLHAEQMNLELGVALRDAGHAVVLDNAGENWQEAVLLALPHFCRQQAGESFAFEDFRHWWAERNGWQPHHPNAWGAVCRIACRTGMIVQTGEYRKAQRVAAHARSVLLYRSKL